MNSYNIRLLFFTTERTEVSGCRSYRHKPQVNPENSILCTPFSDPLVGVLNNVAHCWVSDSKGKAHPLWIKANKYCPSTYGKKKERDPGLGPGPGPGTYQANEHKGQLDDVSVGNRVQSPEYGIDDSYGRWHNDCRLITHSNNKTESCPQSIKDGSRPENVTDSDRNEQESSHTAAVFLLKRVQHGVVFLLAHFRHKLPCVWWKGEK